ncbi:hypothetical protein BSQ39_09080 [Loigolactobacillus backii]|uniref:hypothetical protein n=1 Tax=Loigolactobacillus backii TaxID=375175 RepID=UPI000C1CA0D4|nr:hypothetical protein [Loigolactobacillus backii]PIO83708.1 hypothetical protein BSQ39_09080 [Loigolactobacillus backii]
MGQVNTIKRHILITNGDLITYTEQRYTRKHSTSFHQAVRQQADLNKFDSSFKKELAQIKRAIIADIEKGLTLIENSKTFSVSPITNNVIFSDQVPKKVQQNNKSVELYLKNKLYNGASCGLSRNSILGISPLIQEFRAMGSKEQLELKKEIITEVKQWQRLLKLSPPIKTRGNDKATICTLNVVISIDFEWKYAKFEKGQVRGFGDVLSGQYAMYFPDFPNVKIRGVIFNNSVKGFNFRQFFLMLVDRIQKEFVVTRNGLVLRLNLEHLNVLLTGYFLGVDFSCLSGWNQLEAKLTVINKQKVFSNMPYLFNVRHKKNDDGVDISMTFRDTALLAPQGGLKVLGTIVGQPKMDTTKIDKKDYQRGMITKADYDEGQKNGGYYKTHMDLLLQNHFDLYVDYALNDSIVALKYLKTVMRVYKISWDDFNEIPPTTSNYAMSGVAEALNGNNNEQRIFDPKFPFKEVREDPVGAVREQYRDLYVNSSAAYFGGFNVAFCSAVGTAKICDTDLSSAYNSGGRLMACPDYTRPLELNSLKHLFYNEVMLDDQSGIDFQTLYKYLKKAKGFPFILGVMQISYDYPVDYQGIVTTPQRSPETDNLVYVKHGKDVALQIIDVIDGYEHGANIGIKSAIIPAQHWDKPNAWSVEQSKFLVLRQNAKKKRDKFASKSAEYTRYDAMQVLYKLAGNTIYGKSAQSIRLKKSRNYMTNEIQKIDISKISDPLIAGSYTGITRYLVHKLYDAVGKVYDNKLLPLNITTDGYTFALLGDAIYNSDAINQQFNDKLPDYYRTRLKQIGYSAGYERKGDKADQLTRFYNARTRFNGTADMDTLHAMGGIYYSANDNLQSKVKEIYDLYLNGAIDINSQSSRMSNLTEMKFGARNHAQGVMYDWITPVRIPLMYDCAYQPSQWVGDKIEGFGFNAVPFATVKEHDQWKRHSKILTERWNIMQSWDRYNCYLETMHGFAFTRTGSTLDDLGYADRVCYVFDRLSGKQIPINRAYRNVWTRVQQAIKNNKKLPICKMAIFENQKVGI